MDNRLAGLRSPQPLGTPSLPLPSCGPTPEESAGWLGGGRRRLGKRQRGSYSACVRVLITGTSGVGKSTLVPELRRRGVKAYDADDDGFSEPLADGRWGWRVERVADVLKQGEAAPVWCSSRLLGGAGRVAVRLPGSAHGARRGPRAAVDGAHHERYGGSAEQRAQVLADLDDVEPLLRQSADLLRVTTEPARLIADALLGRVLATLPERDRRCRAKLTVSGDCASFTR